MYTIAFCFTIVLRNVLIICFVACKLIYIFFHGQVHHQFIN